MDPQPIRPHLLLMLALLAVSALTPCLQARPMVLTTHTILADMTREIAGDAVEVTCLVTPGMDLHGFDPTPRDIAPLLQADLVIANGAGFEPWLQRFLAASGYAGPTVNAIDGCRMIFHGDSDEHHHHDHAPGDDDHDDHGHAGEGQADPHAWHDPACAVQFIANIRDALCRIDPASAEIFRRRARLYTAQVETLDAWARRLFALVPAARKRIITAHDSLAYLGRAYGLEILPLRGLDSGSEPDARQVAAIVDALREARASALFAETVNDPRMPEEISGDTGATLGRTLLTDSLSPDGQPGSSYLGMMRENVLNILAAIEPRPPSVATPPAP